MNIIEIKKEIYIPYMRINVKFFMKEECELNVFQLFLIEALQDEATVEQIVQATLLTKHVIETELLQMETQKLVSREHDKIVLTDIAKRVLLITRKVKELNQEDIPMCINLITGEVELYEEELFVASSKDDLIIRQKIFDLDGISIEDNISFFSEKMKSLDSCNDEEKEVILSSIYIEIYKDKQNINSTNMIYKKKICNYLPCLIGDEKCVSGDYETNVIMEGYVIKLFVGYTYPGKEEYGDIMNDLQRIGNLSPELLSDKGNDLVQMNNLCKEYESKQIYALYDCVSGRYSFSPDIEIPSAEIRPQMLLGGLQVIRDETKNHIMFELRESLQVDPRIDIVVKPVKEERYTINICLESLWEEG